MKLKFVLPLLLPLLLSGCKEAIAINSVETVKPVKLVEITDQTDNGKREYLAKVIPNRSAVLSFRVPGQIQSTQFNSGQNVKKGQLVAKLDNTDYQFALDSAQAQFDLAKAKLDRIAQLYEKKLVSADMFDQAEANFKASRASLNQAKTDLSYTELKAPFSGIVSIKHALSHQFVGANQPVYNLINLDAVDVSFNIPITYIDIEKAKSNPFESFDVTLDHYSDHKFFAAFKDISTKPDPDTNSFNVTGTIKVPEGLIILPGMTGIVSIDKDPDFLSTSLPPKAWISSEVDAQNNTLVQAWKFDPGTQRVNKQLVIIDPKGKLISGASAGDIFVVSGLNDLTNGEKVRAWVREGGI